MTSPNTLEEIAATLRMLVGDIEQDSKFELRAFFPNKTATACFAPSQIPEAGGWALAQEERGASGVFVTLNPCNPELEGSAKDGDILCRRWLLIDCDGGEAEEAAREIAAHLAALGWPEGVEANSGNGRHLLYRVDLRVSSPLVKAALDSLAKRWPCVDTSVANPSRITRVYGTSNRKRGKETRPSALLKVPDTPLEPVPVALLEELCKPKALPSNYGDAALKSELATLAKAKEGARNISLNKASFVLGQLIAVGMLHEEKVRAELRRGGMALGLDEAEVESAISSGLSAGKECPRELPTQGGGASLPRVVLSEDQFSVNTEVIAYLARDEAVFQRGGNLVTIRQDPLSTFGFKAAPKIVPLAAPTLRELITRNVHLVRVRKGADGEAIESRANPPDWLVDAVKARGIWAGVRPLSAVIEAPTILEGGEVIEAQGWDASSGLFYCPSEAFPPVPASPSQQDAKDASERLLELVGEFPFVGDAHKAAWLSALLTVVARFAISGACPLFLFEASTPGSGKTLLADLISTLALGCPAPKTTWPGNNEEEIRKRITGLVLEGERLTLLDNVDTALGGGNLEAALTGTSWKDRKLGENESISMPLYLVWMATGNNVAFKGDILRRVMLCRLEPACERPEERAGFKIDNLLSYARDNRASLLSDALTLLKAHALAGYPCPALPLLGGFEAWDRKIRQAVRWAVGIDPLESKEGLVAFAADPEAEARSFLLKAWGELPGARDKGLTVGEALKLIESYPNLKEALGDVGTSQGVGAKLRKLQGRVIDGEKIEAIPGAARSVRWRVGSVDT